LRLDADRLVSGVHRPDPPPQKVEALRPGSAPSAMLDASVVRLLSGILAVIGFLGIFASVRQLRGSRRTEPPVRASRPAGAVLHQVWELAVFLPFVFLVVGAVVPSWVYGTSLNLSFSGGEILQLSAVPIWLAGGTLFAWSARTLGRFMVVQIAVFEDHQLVTQGPYARIRHPTYTSVVLMTVAAALLYLNLILIVDVVVVAVIASARARREEGLLGSPEGFGARYREYMAHTGRFVPRWR